MAPRLEAGPQTVHWGYFDASLPPVLTIESGDEVVITTVSGGPDMMPPAPLVVPSSLSAIHRHVTRRMVPGHICTGPIAVRGARAGHVLQVEIDAIDLHYDWGFNNISPLRGTLPYDFDESRLIHIPLDREAQTGRLPWGTEIPLRPFFGVMAVAPPPAWGAISTLPPRPNGGNIDNRELITGTTLYLPVYVDDALFSVGDGHAAQGDGEICLSAIETGLVGTFRLTARNDMTLAWPLAETPTHLITMAFDPDLDDAVMTATRQMLDQVTARTGLDRYQAYTILSLAGDLRVTQVVNGNKGIHLMLDKRFLGRTG